MLGGEHEHHARTAPSVREHRPNRAPSEQRVKRDGAVASWSMNRLNGKQARLESRAGGGERRAEFANHSEKPIAQAIAVRAIDRQRTLGRVQIRDRRRTAMRARLALRRKAFEEIVARGDHGQWRTESFRQRRDEHHAIARAAAPGKRSRAAAAIWLRDAWML